jgi:hypothetical protein
MLRVALIAVVVAGVEVQTSPDDSKHEVISQGVDYGRLSVGCSRAEIEFSGRLLFRSPGSPKRPLSRATFVADNGWDDPTSGEVVTSSQGTFRIELLVWDHAYSTRHEGQYRRSTGRSRVTVSATGCRSRTFNVGPGWRPKTLVLKCSDVGSED